jgi:AhpD family alkylhydroperoxidase
MQPRLNFFKAGPDAMQSLSSLEQRINESGLEKSLIELVRVRASQINGCAFCVDRHTDEARKAGESERRLTMLAHWRETPLFTERECAALDWTEALTLIAGKGVHDDVWSHADSQFTNQELVDLTLVVTAVNAWNRFAMAFRKLPV